MRETLAVMEEIKALYCELTCTFSLTVILWPNATGIIPSKSVDCMVKEGACLWYLRGEKSKKWVVPRCKTPSIRD